MNQFVPCLTVHRDGPELAAITLGHPLLDDYLAFVGGAGPDEHVAGGGLGSEGLLRGGRQGAGGGERGGRVRVLGRSAGSAPGCAGGAPGGWRGRAWRRARSPGGCRACGALFAYLAARGDAGVADNPVPGSLAARRPGGRRGNGGVPLIRTPRTLPRVLSPGEVDALVGALRTHRDRAMVEAMLLGGLRRCEVLGLRLEDVNAGERRLFVAEGKGGRQRIVPVSGGSSPPSAPIWNRSGRRPRRARGCSSCSRVLAAERRCRRPGWTRSSTAPAAARG